MSDGDIHADSLDDARRQRMLDAREQLVRVLTDIAGAAAEQSLVRCPYRTRTDVCTFRGGCRNQIVQPHTPRQCAGGRLDPTPVTAAEIAAAPEQPTRDSVTETYNRDPRPL